MNLFKNTQERYFGYLRQVFDGGYSLAWQTPARQKLAIKATLGNLFLLAAIFLVGRLGVLEPIWLAALVMLWLPLHILATGAINSACGGIFELSDDYIDEFQVALRNDCYRRGQRVSLMVIVMLIAWAGVHAATGSVSTALALDVVLGLLFAALLGGMAPRILAARSLAGTAMDDEVATTLTVVKNARPMSKPHD